MTLGYIIIARDAACLAAARDHEMVHVAQNGRWGPLFFPAYGISSLIEHMRGRDAYRDNLFEREAYAAASIEFPADGEPPAAC